MSARATRRSRERGAGARVVRVGVVGGSYAGCCLARKLVLEASPGIAVTVLELRTEQELCSVPGTLNFFRGAETLAELQLLGRRGGGEEAMRAIDDGSGRRRTSKRKLLRALVGSLRGIIAFGLRVDGIQRASDGTVVVTCSNTSDSGDGDDGGCMCGGGA